MDSISVKPTICKDFGKLTKLGEIERVSNSGLECIVTCTFGNGIKHAIVSAYCKELLIINLNTMEITQRIYENSNPYWLRMYHNDGKKVNPGLLVSGDSGGRVKLWRVLNDKVEKKPRIFSVCTATGNNDLWRMDVIDDGDLEMIQVLATGWSAGDLSIMKARAFVDKKGGKEEKDFELKKCYAENVKFGYMWSSYQLRKPENRHLICLGFSSPARLCLLDWSKEKTIPEKIEQEKLRDTIFTIRSFVEKKTKKELILFNNGPSLRIIEIGGTIRKEIEVGGDGEIRSIFYVSDQYFIFGGNKRVRALIIEDTDLKNSKVVDKYHFPLDEHVGAMRVTTLVDDKPGIDGFQFVVCTSAKRVYKFALNGIQAFQNREIKDTDEVERVDYLRNVDDDENEKESLRITLSNSACIQSIIKCLLIN